MRRAGFGLHQFRTCLCVLCVLSLTRSTEVGPEDGTSDQQADLQELQKLLSVAERPFVSDLLRRQIALLRPSQEDDKRACFGEDCGRGDEKVSPVDKQLTRGAEEKGKKRKQRAAKEAPAHLRLIAEEIRQGKWAAHRPPEDDEEFFCAEDDSNGYSQSVGADAAEAVDQQQKCGRESEGGASMIEKASDTGHHDAGSRSTEHAQAQNAGSGPPDDSQVPENSGRDRADEDTTERQGGLGGKEKEDGGRKKWQKRGEGGAAKDEEFIGAPGRWVEVESPKVKVTLLPYGVAECNYVQGQLETCQLEGCHSGRPYPECHQEKAYPRHPIDSDTLLPLPPLPPPRLPAASHPCGRAFDGEAPDAALLRAQLDALQRPADCRRARLMVYYHHVSGLAAELHKLALALSMAAMTRRTLVVAESAGWDYADPAACNGSTVRCHMQGLNQWCTEADAGAESPDILLGRCCFMNDTLISDPRRVVRVNQTTIEQHKLSLYYKTVPRVFAARGLFWWRAQLTSYIFRPLPHMRPGPAPRSHVSMHVRHDNTAEADAIPTATYVAQALVAAQMLAEASPASATEAVALFLAADSAATEAEVAGLVAAHNRDAPFQVALFPEEAAERRKGTHSRRHSHQEAVDIFRALGRLADADVFVGKFSSGVSRLIAELGCVSGRFKHMPVSVDRKWGVTCP